MKKKECCDNCKFLDFYYCRRYPPTHKYYNDNYKKVLEIEVSYPYVKGTYWCGEYKRLKKK